MRQDRYRGYSYNQSETTGITQAYCPPEERTTKRAQQINSLHQEFEDLKKKIKDVENKNQKIMSKIHKQHNFKKKVAQTQIYTAQNAPIVYYEQQDIIGKDHNSSSSNKSDKSQYEFQMRTKKSYQNEQKSKQHLQLMHSMDYKPNQIDKSENLLETNSINKKSKQTKRNVTPSGMSRTFQKNNYYQQQQKPIIRHQYNEIIQPQISMQYTPYHHQQSIASMSQNSPYSPIRVSSSPLHPSSLNPSIVHQYQQSIRLQKQSNEKLQIDISEKQAQIYLLKNKQIKFNNYYSSIHVIIENNLENFMSNVLGKCLYKIERSFKKNENKLKNMSVRIKDQQEEQISKKLINKHRRRKSNSSRRELLSPTKQTKLKANHVDDRINKFHANLPRKSLGSNQDTSKKSLSKLNQSYKKNKQFQQIAAKYQEIIKNKNLEIQRLEIMLQKKQFIEEECQDLSSKNKEKKTHRLSTEENLLKNIEQSYENERLKNKNIQLEEQLSQTAKKFKDGSLMFENLQEQLKLIQEHNIKLLKQVSENKMIENCQEQRDLNINKKIESNQKQLHLQIEENNLLKAKLIQQQKLVMQKQCENYAMGKKVMKNEQLLQNREQKIQQLEKLMSNSQGFTQVMDRSIYIDTNVAELKKLTDEIQRLENTLEQEKKLNFKILEQINSQKQEKKIIKIELLKIQKQNQELEGQNLNLKMNLHCAQDHAQSSDDNECPILKSSDLSDIKNMVEEDRDQLQQELQTLTKKYQQLNQSYNKIQNQNLLKNTQQIKLKSQIQFLRDSLSTNESKYETLKQDVEMANKKITQLEKIIQQKEIKIDQQRRFYQIKINENCSNSELSKGKETKNQEEQILLDEFGEISVKSTIISNKKTANLMLLQEQNQFLNDKLKEAEALIETHNMMEAKVIGQYKGNVDRVKAELKQKKKQIEKLQEQNNQLNQKIRKYDTLHTENLQGQQLHHKNQNERLQRQLNETKIINNKLTDMNQQLFKQINQKQDEKEEAYKIIEMKRQKIKDLQQYLSNLDNQLLPEINLSNSHNRSNPQRRQSLKSQNSLLYSALSQSRNDKTIEFDLSEAGSQMFDSQLLNVSNVSEVFNREQFPYEKINIRKKQHVKLFEKTASYIKSLKNAINQKNTRIHILEKKIDSMKDSELIRKDIYEIKQNDVVDNVEYFRDYDSVQLEYKKSRYQNKYRQLQHDTRLVIEENNMLINQIEGMQEQLLKAQEQQNSLVKIKDLYKDEIKKLIKKNQDQSQKFEEQLLKERKKLQESGTYHNMEAIKQLFLKIMNILAYTQQDKSLSKTKKNEKSKEIQQYLKVLCSLLNVDIQQRNKILTAIYKSN